MLAGAALVVVLVVCGARLLVTWRCAQRAERHQKLLIQLQRQAAERRMYKLTQDAVQKLMSAAREGS
jgi:hypothetical protein